MIRSLRRSLTRKDMQTLLILSRRTQPSVLQLLQVYACHLMGPTQAAQRLQSASACIVGCIATTPSHCFLCGNCPLHLLSSACRCNSGAWHQLSGGGPDLWRGQTCAKGRRSGCHLRPFLHRAACTLACTEGHDRAATQGDGVSFKRSLCSAC